MYLGINLIIPLYLYILISSSDLDKHCLFSVYVYPSYGQHKA
jgi:hypothetical protein